MLELSRKIDYRAITIRELIIRGEVAVEEDCSSERERANSFAAVYAAEAEVLCEAMLEAGRRQGSWRQGVHAALMTLLRFAAERPAVANALFREVYVVGGPALAKREEMVGRLTVALGGGYEGVEEAMGAPHPARFVIGAVEGVIAGHLSRGQAERLPGVGPELSRFIVASFQGIEASKELPVDA
jgi:hypothetical protein